MHVGDTHSFEYAMYVHNIFTMRGERSFVCEFIISTHVKQIDAIVKFLVSAEFIIN